MKHIILITACFKLTLISCSDRPLSKPIERTGEYVIDTTKHMDEFTFSLETAHPQAKLLMKEDFYWSPIEETAPFGSDDGSDAAYGFREWRMSNKSSSPLTYFKELINRWNYPIFDWSELDTLKIREFISSKSSIDEATIQQKMEEFKEVLKNSDDISEKNWMTVN